MTTVMTITDTQQWVQKCIFCGMSREEIIAYPTDDCTHVSGTHRFGN